MNRAEAFKIIGLNQSATDEEVKKKFKKLVFEKHPDRNKDANAAEDFVKMKAAYEFIINPPPPQAKSYPGDFGGFNININDFIGRVARPIFKPKPISITISITFNESVLGCTKKISFDRTLPCVDCGGLGHDVCATCSGTGQTRTVQKHGNMNVINSVPCDTCRGVGHSEVKCKKCSGKNKQEHIEADVNVPGGIHNGQIIRLRGIGNVIVNNNMMAQGDVLLSTIVESDQDMRIQEQDVISIIELPLCDALQGVAKKVRTVKGDTTIMIRKGSKHKDQIKLSGYGVMGKGNHIFTIDVSYPKNIDKLVEFLENNKE